MSFIHVIYNMAMSSYKIIVYVMICVVKFHLFSAAGRLVSSVSLVMLDAVLQVACEDLCLFLCTQ